MRRIAGVVVFIAAVAALTYVTRRAVHQAQAVPPSNCAAVPPTASPPRRDTDRSVAERAIPGENAGSVPRARGETRRDRVGSAVQTQRGRRLSERGELDPSWRDVPVSGAKVLGRHAGTLTRGLVASDVMEGIKSNCLYDEGRTSWEVPPSEGATILVLSLESRNDEIQIIDAEAVTPGRADEYQLRCFESWLANRVIPAEGIPSGQRYRVRFPVAF